MMCSFLSADLQCAVNKVCVLLEMCLQCAGNTAKPGYNHTVHATPRILHEAFCGIDSFLIENHNIVLLCYNNNRL